MNLISGTTNDTIRNNDLGILSPMNWVQDHQEYLFKFAILRIKDDELVRDLVQETFLSALQNLSRFRYKSSERTWLTAILRKKILKTYYKKSKNIFVFVENYDSQYLLNSGDSVRETKRDGNLPIEDYFNDKDLKRIIQDCTRRLPDLWQAVFIQKFILDESREQTCCSLNISDAYYWVICHRLKNYLKKHLDRHWF